MKSGMSRCPRCGERAGRMISRPKSACVTDISYYDAYEFRAVCAKCQYTTDVYPLGRMALEAWETEGKKRELH